MTHDVAEGEPVAEGGRMKYMEGGPGTKGKALAVPSSGQRNKVNENSKRKQKNENKRFNRPKPNI